LKTPDFDGKESGFTGKCILKKSYLAQSSQRKNLSASASLRDKNIIDRDVLLVQPAAKMPLNGFYEAIRFDCFLKIIVLHGAAEIMAARVRVLAAERAWR
jgi:hypothetical protein